MKRILLLMLLAIGAMCFGCKSDKDKKPPTNTVEYLDVENLWAMYYKDIKTVKDSMTATYVSERDTMIYKQPRKILTFIKDTPAGRFNIECTFIDNKLVEIMARSGFLNSPQESSPHYLAISENVQNFISGNVTLFPYGAEFFGLANCGVSGEGQQDDLYKSFQGSKNSRTDFLKYMNDKIMGFTPTENENYMFGFSENRTANEYDPIIGQPTNTHELIHKKIRTLIGTYPDGKTYMYLSIDSALNVWPEVPDDELTD